MAEQTQGSMETTAAVSQVGKKGARWKSHEDKRVAMAYLKVCYDPVVGTGQTGTTMWANFFQEACKPGPDGVPGLVPPFRTPHGVETRWGIISRRCSKYQSWYDAAGRPGAVPSGAIPEVWQRQEACRRHKEEFRGAQWCMQDALDVLQASPRWRRENSLDSVFAHLNAANGTTSSNVDPPPGGGLANDNPSSGSTTTGGGSTTSRKRSSALVLGRPGGRDRGRQAKRQEEVDQTLVRLQRQSLKEQIAQGEAAKDAKTIFIGVHAASLTPNDKDSQDLLKLAKDNASQVLMRLSLQDEGGDERGDERGGPRTNPGT
eukprot:GHVU01004379.1.p1 GENE.GHVU01004379.1~~GHVU01004379.1.p1  ORF type:complete len:317 (+),score=45.02 GHVU01004379.1:412-1362(+)